VKTLGHEEFWIAPAASVPIQSRIIFCFVVRRESILREWIPLVAGKFKYAIPVEMDMVGFYNAMATLMAIQIRQLVEESITSFIRLKNFQTSQEITTDNDFTPPALCSVEMPDNDSTHPALSSVEIPQLPLQSRAHYTNLQA
jgi:hypothetical protein